MKTDLLTKCIEYGEREFYPGETIKLLNMYGFRFWSWGASGFINLNNKGLVFKVKGHHHKGYVCINLAWNDTYTVRLISTQGNEKFKQEEVYCDMLFDVLDEQIERIPEYVR